MDLTLSYTTVIAAVSFLLMVMACVEVGSNDAANLVNAVFGARILSRRRAVWISGTFVILGAICASPVLDTIRKGIFDSAYLTADAAIAIFMASYLVNTLLLFVCSGYGLPVSTTATLVFSLAGGALGVSGAWESVYWSALSRVMMAILISIFFSGVIGFVLQRALRTLVGEDCTEQTVVKRHGPWITGLLLTNLVWFMVVNGMGGLPPVQWLQSHVVQPLGIFGFLLLLMGVLTLATAIFLRFAGAQARTHLFSGTAVIGMACMAFAFGQNDLANCAAPGLAIQMIINEGLAGATQDSIPFWALFGCGFLMFLGMTTKRAQRVTRAEVNMASQHDRVNLYAPGWTIFLADKWLKLFAPKALEHKEAETYFCKQNTEGKKIHYDALRASLILAIGASVIAVASGFGLPVSTTYVGFAAVIATGWGDRVFEHGPSDVKMGRAIWVVTSWVLASLMAGIGGGLIAWIIKEGQLFGLFASLALNLYLRSHFKKSSDKHEESYHLHAKH